MLRDGIRRALIDNAALKAVAFVLAVTLFILVRGDEETERSVRVGVAYVRPSDRVVVSDVPDGIDVWLRGPWTRIKRLDPADVDPIVVDLTKASEGDLTIDVESIRVPAGLRIASVRPTKVYVEFEHLKKVPVVPEAVGAPAPGFSVERIAAEPTAVVVRGAKEVLAGLAKVSTLPVSIAGRRATFREEVALGPLPRGVTAEKARVAVEVVVAEEIVSRALPAIAVTLRGATNGRALAADAPVVKPATVQVSLRGTAGDLATVDPSKVVAVVDVTADDLQPGRTRRARVLMQGIPAGIAVELQPAEVTLVAGPAAGK